MPVICVGSLGRALGQALDLLAAAVQDCTDELWELPMWPVAVPEASYQFFGPDWQPVTSPEERDGLAERWVERRSTPWSVAWHALECFDYDLTGEFGPWAPPPPFTGHPHWRDLATLPAAWSRVEILGYIEHCRERARSTLAEMTEEQAARPLPPAHRCAGEPHAWVIVDLAIHATEHAAQIRQFLAGKG